MKKSILFIFAIIASLLVSAQTDSLISISLDEAIIKGLKENYQILIGNKELEIAKNNNDWGKAGRLPTVSLSVSQSNRYANSLNKYTGGRSDVITNSLTPALNAQMILFNGFAVRLNKNNLELYERMSQLSLKNTQENTITNIVNAYYSVLLEAEKLKVAEELMKLSKDRYKYIQLKKDLGVAVTYDVLQLQNNFLTDSANYLMQLMNKKSADRELSKTLGDNELKEYVPTDDFMIKDTVYSLEDMENLMLEKNSVLEIQYLNKEILDNTVKLAKSTMYPSLSLNAGADHTNSMISYLDEYQYHPYTYGAYANLSLSYTIFNGNNRKRNISNAKIESEKNILQTEELEMLMKNNLFMIWQLTENRKQLLNVSEENYKAAKLNLDIAEEKFNAGAITSFNYRDIQLSYLNSANRLIQSKFNLIVTEYDLMKITGSILKTNE